MENSIVGRKKEIMELLSLISHFCLHFDFCNLDFLAIFEKEKLMVDFIARSSTLQLPDIQ